MRISVESIKETPVTFEEDIEAKNWDMDSFDIHFVDKIHIKCDFSRVGKEILVKTEVKTRRIISCSRCLTEVGQEVTQKFDLYYDVAQLGEYLEVDEDIRQEILLNFPLKVLCRKDCKGLCPGCGVNLNYEECRCNLKLKKGVKNGTS